MGEVKEEIKLDEKVETWALTKETMPPLSKEAAEAFAPFLLIPTEQTTRGGEEQDDEELSLTGLRRKKVKKVKTNPLEVVGEGVAILTAALPVDESTQQPTTSSTSTSTSTTTTTIAPSTPTSTTSSTTTSTTTTTT